VADPSDKPTKPKDFPQDQVDLIKRTIARGASTDELQLFLHQCKRTGLDPFTRQIYFTKRRVKNRETNQWEEVGTTQTGIDGFRVIAERTEEYDGSDTAWCGPDGVWKDAWLSDDPPSAARTIVHRKGCQYPFTAIAKWKEYVQTTGDGSPVSMWRKMPANQLAKCSEALGLRKAFPNDLGGLYTDAEMAQAENGGEAELLVESEDPLEGLDDDLRTKLDRAFGVLQQQTGGFTQAQARVEVNRYLTNGEPAERAEQANRLYDHLKDLYAEREKRPRLTTKVVDNRPKVGKVDKTARPEASPVDASPVSQGDTTPSSGLGPGASAGADPGQLVSLDF
jgi:phage recombination protein Bet